LLRKEDDVRGAGPQVRRAEGVRVEVGGELGRDDELGFERLAAGSGEQAGGGGITPGTKSGAGAAPLMKVIFHRFSILENQTRLPFLQTLVDANIVPFLGIGKCTIPIDDDLPLRDERQAALFRGPDDAVRSAREPLVERGVAMLTQLDD
jgi:hypothetical protein